MTGPLVGRVIVGVRHAKIGLGEGFGEYRTRTHTVRIHPDTFTALVIEEGEDPDQLMRLEGHRIAGHDLIVDPEVVPGWLVVESAPWVTQQESTTPGVTLQHATTFRASVIL